MEQHNLIYMLKNCLFCYSNLNLNLFLHFNRNIWLIVASFFASVAINATGKNVFQMLQHLPGALPLPPQHLPAGAIDCDSLNF